MGKYVVVERSFINNRLHEPGEVVDVEFTDGGVAGPNLVTEDEYQAPKPKRKGKVVPPATGARPTDAGTGDDLT